MLTYLTQTNMERRIVQKVVYTGYINTEPTVGIMSKLGELFDESDIVRVTHNNVLVDEEIASQYTLEIIRSEPETDEDYEKRMTSIANRQQMALRHREKLYQKLKEEFEPKTSGL